MLRYLRENTGNWIIKFFLGIIVIVFVFLGVGSIGSKKGNTVATVNDEPITIKEFQQAYKAQIQQLQAQFGNNLNDDLIKALNVKQLVVDQLIEQRLLLNEAERLEIKVSDREVQDLVMSIKAFEKDGLFDLETYKNVLARNSLNPETFEINQKIALKQQKVKNMVTGSVNVSDLEAQEFYRFQNTKMAVDYIHFSPENYTDIKPTEEQIQSYYDENKNAYLSEAKRKAAFLKFSPSDYKDQVAVTDKMIKDYYDQNIAEFQTPEKIEARHILIRLEPEADELAVATAENKAMEVYTKATSGEDFEALAREFSEGPSKSSGGYLGTFEHKSMVKPFADAAFALKAGEISKPVKTQFGLHVIKVISKFEASTQTYEDAADSIRDKLTKENLGYLAYDKAGEAFDAVIDGDDFEQVAMIAQKNIRTTDAFDNSGKGLAFPDAYQFAQAAFGLENDEISDVKQFNDAYYLIKVTQIIEPAVQPLDAVKAQVEKDVMGKLQNEAALADAKNLLEKAIKASSFEGLGLPSDIKIESTPLFTRNGQIENIQDSAKIVEAGFTLDKDSNIYSQVLETGKGFYLISFKESQTPDTKDLADDLKSIKNELTWRKQNQSYQAWLGELKLKSEIKLNAQILN